MMIKICEFCGKKIKAKTKAKRFCDDFCQRKHYYRRPEINKKIREYTRAYQQTPAFKERNRKRLKLYRQTPEFKEKNRVLAATKYREKRRLFWEKYGKRPEIRARIRGRDKARRLTDKKFLIADRLRRSLNHAMTKYSKTGKIMSSKKYGIDWKKIIEHLRPFPENLKSFEIDHIIPLHSFDLTDLKQLKKAFSPENLRWLTREENRRKSGKIVFNKN